MRWSIRSQLLIPLVILLLGIAGISVWTVVASAERAVRQQIEMQVRNVAQTLNEAHFPLTQTTLERLRGLSGAEYLLVTSSGERIATLAELPSDLPPAVAGDDWEQFRLGPPVAIGEHNYLVGGVRLRPARTETPATLYILYPGTRWREALWSAVRPSLLLAGLGSLIALALAVALAHRLSGRVRALEQRTRRIAAGDFSAAPLAGWNDELRDLERSVNDMAQRLAQLQETVRKTERLRLLGQVSGGLAHQMRNNATGARLAVQLHARECSRNGEAEALEVAVRQLTLLEEKLRRFLDLGRAETPRREPCALSVLLKEAVELMRPQCRHLQVDLSLQVPAAELTVEGDEGQLGHLLVNVLGNAVEAAGPGGAVGVRLVEPDSPASGMCNIEVWDSGPGPESDVANRLFEPFVTSKRDGVGLGLAVARQVAQQHGGTIHWHRECGRTCFRIELPLCASKFGRTEVSGPPA